MTSLSKKICLLGDFAVGKSSLMRRFVYDRFDDSYMSTIGVKVSRKTIMTARDADIVELNMMIWDLAGSEEFSPVRASYLGGAAGAVVICDFTRPKTLQHLNVYVEDFQSIRPGAQILLAANKCDLTDERAFDERAIATVAQAMGLEYYLTSAKEGDEVEAMFRRLGRLMV